MVWELPSNPSHPMLLWSYLRHHSTGSAQLSWTLTCGVAVLWLPDPCSPAHMCWFLGFDGSRAQIVFSFASVLPVSWKQFLIVEVFWLLLCSLHGEKKNCFWRSPWSCPTHGWADYWLAAHHEGRWKWAATCQNVKTSERNHSRAPNKCSFLSSWWYYETDFCFYWVENIYSSKVCALFVLNQIQSGRSCSCEVVKANTSEPFLLPAEKQVEEQRKETQLYPAARGSAQEVGAALTVRRQHRAARRGVHTYWASYMCRVSSRMLSSPSLPLRCRGCPWEPGGRSAAAPRGLDGSWRAAVSTGQRGKEGCGRSAPRGSAQRAWGDRERGWASELPAGTGAARRWDTGIVSVCSSPWRSFPRTPVWRVKKERRFSFNSEFRVILEVWSSFPSSLFFLFLLFLF